MDRLRSGGCGAAVSKGGRLSRDTDVHRLDAERVGQEADCQRSCGRLVYECRGSLTFNGTPGNLKLMNARTSAAGEVHARRFQQGPEDAVNFPVDERAPLVRNEDMISTAVPSLAVHQVLTYPRHCGVVQGHQSGFLKLGFPDQ